MEEIIEEVLRFFYKHASQPGDEMMLNSIHIHRTWLKEKLTDFQKKTKEEFLKRILPEKHELGQSEIDIREEWKEGHYDCINEILTNAEKDGVTLIK